VVGGDSGSPDLSSDGTLMVVSVKASMEGRGGEKGDVGGKRRREGTRRGRVLVSGVNDFKSTRTRGSRLSVDETKMHRRVRVREINQEDAYT